jgi:hypothetical protein
MTASVKSLVRDSSHGAHKGTPRRARVPPIDYRDGLTPCLTSKEETDITTIIQRRPQHPRRTGRDQSEQLVAIRRNEWSRSSECALLPWTWAAAREPQQRAARIALALRTPASKSSQNPKGVEASLTRRDQSRRSTGWCVWRAGDLVMRLHEEFGLSVR